MSKVHNVLVAIDFSPGSRAALESANKLAGGLGARLVALHVAPPYATFEQLPAFPPLAPIDPERQRQVREELQQFVAPAEAGGPLVETFLRDGNPADEILAHAAETGVDLIVMGAHGRRGFERWMLGSVTERVARRASCSVLGVPAGSPGAALGRVLCALDLSPSSAATLEQAAAVAQALRAGLRVLYVADGSHWYEPGPLSGVDVEAMREAVAKSAQERLHELIARHVPKGISADVQVAFGSVTREVERVAGEGADMVVLGASSSSGVDRFFFGSTAQHVLRACVAPVLLVRTPLAKAPAA
ncbi:MAG TPA: universal stress protein [Vicinamibacteria bacterium]